MCAQTHAQEPSTANGRSNESVHDASGIALLLIDVINDLDFPEGKQLAKAAIAMARQIRSLKRFCGSLNIPSIYVNDNFGRWRSDFRATVRNALKANSLGRPMAKLLAPGPRDYFVLKPRHSAFFSTALEVLLESLNAHTLVLTGVATNICVLYSANDAYLRHYRLVVPRDCVAANTTNDTRYALRQMRTLLKAETRPWKQVRPKLKELVRVRPIR